LNNPDTLTKYKTAAQISQKVLQDVLGLCIEGETIISVCEKGDKILEEETSKVYKGKKILKGKKSFLQSCCNIGLEMWLVLNILQSGISHPTTVSPSSYVTPYTPLASDVEEAATKLSAGDVIKVQLGAQIDGLGTIVCDNIVVAPKDGKADIDEKTADLLLATHYANELLLRLMLPAGLLDPGTEEEKKAKSSSAKPFSSTRATNLLQKVAETYGCNLVEGTTSWLFERNEIEGKKKFFLSPSEGMKPEGIPEVGDVWGIEVALSLGTGKIKTLTNRPTLHRRTTTTYALKRPTARQMLSEIVKKFGTFPFSLRQLDDERAAKMGVLECVRANVLRQYEVVADKDGALVARVFSTIGEFSIEWEETLVADV